MSENAVTFLVLAVTALLFAAFFWVDAKLSIRQMQRWRRSVSQLPPERQEESARRHDDFYYSFHGL